MLTHPFAYKAWMEKYLPTGEHVVQRELDEALQRVGQAVRIDDGSTWCGLSLLIATSQFSKKHFHKARTLSTVNHGYLETPRDSVGTGFLSIS